MIQNIKIQASGIKTELRLTDGLQWSHPSNGHLIFEQNHCNFNDWKIYYLSIKDAVLNTETTLWKKSQTLLIDTGQNKYQFGLLDLIDESFMLPFPHSISESRSFIGKAVMLPIYFLGIYLAFISSIYLFGLLK